LTSATIATLTRAAGVSVAKWTNASPIVPKPEQPDLPHIQILRRTDGRLIIYDDRRPLGRRTVWLAAKGVELAPVIRMAMKYAEKYPEGKMPDD
jgi:hypothetical protein